MSSRRPCSRVEALICVPGTGPRLNRGSLRPQQLALCLATSLIRRRYFAHDRRPLTQRRDHPPFRRLAGGEDIDHFGEYQQIERPNCLVFTLEVPWHFPGVTRVSVEISPVPGGCVMRFTQTGVKPEVTEGSWREMFTTLATVLDDLKSA